MKSAAGERLREAVKETTGVSKWCNHQYGLFATKRQSRRYTAEA